MSENSKDTPESTLGVKSSEGLASVSRCSEVTDKKEKDKMIIPLKNRKSKSKKDDTVKKYERQRDSIKFDKTTEITEKKQLANLHIQKMPFITDSKNENRMVAWTDLKEILFPSCSHPQCDIVVNVLKLKLSYPWSEDAMHPCSPKEHVAFLRKYRIVPSGLLLVDIDRLKPHLEELWDMVKIKHQKSNNEHSKQCHYAKAQTRVTNYNQDAVCKKKATHAQTCLAEIETENDDKMDSLGGYTKTKETIKDLNLKESSVCQQTTSKEQNADGIVRPKVDLESDTERENKCILKLPLGKPKLKSIDTSGTAKPETQVLPKLKSSKDAKKQIPPFELKSPDICNVVLKKITFPAVVVEIKEASFSLFIPAYLLELCFPPLVKFLIQACRDHLVRGNIQNLTRCCSVAEGRAFTRWMCKVYGWAQNWRHITSRDILVRKSDVEHHLSSLESCQNYQIDMNYLSKNLFDIRDLSSVPKSVPGGTSDGNVGLNKIVGGYVQPTQIAENSKTPENSSRQPKKRQRIKSPNESTPTSITQKNIIPSNINFKMGEKKEYFSDNTNNSALTDDLPCLEQKPSRRFCANSNKKSETISNMEVKAFGRLSRPDSVQKFKDVKSKMLTLEDKMKSQWEINKSKMKKLEDRILKKLEESKVSRDRMISEHFNFNSDNSVKDKMSTANSLGNSLKKDESSTMTSLRDKRHGDDRYSPERLPTQECKLGKNKTINNVSKATSSFTETTMQTPQPVPPPACSVMTGENNHGYCVNATFQQPISVPSCHYINMGVQNNPRQMLYNPNNFVDDISYQKVQQHAQQMPSVYQYNQGWYECNHPQPFHFQNQGFYQPTQSNVLPAFTSSPPKPPLPLYPNSSYGVSKSRLQNFYPQENYVTFQPVGNWPRYPPISKIKRTMSIKHIENNLTQKNNQLSLQPREVSSVSVSSKSSKTCIPSTKESKSVDLNEQADLQSEWNKHNNNKVTMKGKITLKNPPKLPNDLVGAIVEESKKSLARISSMSSTKMLSKKTDKINNSSMSAVSKFQVPESEQALLALVSSNPFTQSLESLKAMKDIKSKQQEANSSCKQAICPSASTSLYSPFKTKHRSGPIQRSNGILGNSDNVSKNGSKISTSVENLITSNSLENIKISYISKTTSNYKDVQRQIGITNNENVEKINNNGVNDIDTETREDNQSNAKTTSSNKENDKHSVNRKGNQLADESKSEGCISRKKEQAPNTPVRHSSSAPSLWRKTASLFGKLHKDYGSYESIPGENLKMTFLRIKDSTKNLDNDSKKNTKDGKERHKHSKNEASQKKEKTNEGKGRQKSYRNNEDDSIDLDDMQSILSAMQRSYKRHENTKIYRPKGNNSFSSYESAEKIYGANYTNQKAKHDGGNNVSIVKYRKSTSPNRRKDSNYQKTEHSRSDSEPSSAKGKPTHIPLPISMDRIQLKSRSELRQKDEDKTQKVKPKAYDECKIVLEKLNLLSYEGSNSILSDRRIDAKENLCCLNTFKEKRSETVEDSLEIDTLQMDNTIKLNSPTSHPKKRWMKDFMVCGPQKLERIASMDLLAVEENIEPDKVISNEWTEDTFSHYDISLNSKTDSPYPEIDGRTSPPVLSASSDIPNSGENSRPTSPPTLQLEFVKGSDLTVDHEEEVTYESESSTKLISSTSISLCSQNDTSPDMASSFSSNNQLERSPKHVEEERNCTNPINGINVTVNSNKEEDMGLEGSLFVVDDTKLAGRVHVIRRSARQSISPLKNVSKKELDPINGKKINLHIPRYRGEKNKFSKSKNTGTPEKKRSHVKKNKNLFSNYEDQEQASPVCNDMTIWENVVKEQKIILDIIKRKTSKKDRVKSFSAKSEKSDENADRGPSVPPCNTPCSLAEDNDVDRYIVKSQSKYGYGDGLVKNSESFQHDKEELIDLVVKLEPKETNHFLERKEFSSSNFKDYKASGDVDRFCDSVNAKKEEFMKPDAYGFLYEPIKSEHGLSKGGLIYHDKIVIPYVMINGYKYVAVVDVLQLFTQCSQKCVIPRNTLRKHRGLFRSYCNWEQMYVLDLLYVRRNRKLKTGDTLLRFDNFVKNLTELRAVIKEKHRSTTCKRSKDCNYSFK